MSREPRTCSHCGHTGPDVHLWRVRPGGRGYTLVDQCTDAAACWQRWEQLQNATAMDPTPTTHEGVPA